LGIDWPSVKDIALQLAEVRRMGIDLVVVVGAGNWFRGRWVAKWSLDPAVADYIGMLATVMNGLALQEAVEELKVKTRLMTAIDIPKVAEPYIRRKALSHLRKGRIVILAAGVGTPFFTTDTAAALRALELNCQVIFKGSNIDGVYDKDPHKQKGAKRYDQIGFEKVIRKSLRVMDGAAFALCRDKKMPIIIFNLNKKGAIKRVLQNKKEGTIVS